MPAIYHIGLKIYWFLLYLASFFNKKAALWIKGRRNWENLWRQRQPEPGIWFHFASLGEFEQGKPLLEAVRKRFPQQKITITFFSPSGYEIRKNSPLGDYILYLPLDTEKNAAAFIEIFKPKMAIFNKYEYWYNFFKALHQQQIPLYVTSAIFRPQQAFFKSYGHFNRKTLSYVTHFFVQNSSSAALLESIGLHNFTISGDTRFDSVSNLSQKIKDLPFMQQFKGDSSLLIAGSSWPEDEKLLAEWFKKQGSNWKMVFAPHEIKSQKINNLAALFKPEEVLKHSELSSKKPQEYSILIIDNIGMLSSLYPFGEIAYIGGGFGAGIHNTLEAAAWGVPVIFGPHYQKFQEAKDLIAEGAGFSISDQTQLDHTLQKLVHNDTVRQEAGSKAKSFVNRNLGATALIMEHVFYA